MYIGLLLLLELRFLVVILGRRTCYLRTGMWLRRRRGSCFIRLWKAGRVGITTIKSIGGIRTCLLLPVGNLLGRLGMNGWIFRFFRCWLVLLFFKRVSLKRASQSLP